MTERALTGSSCYNVFTPVTTRKTPEEYPDERLGLSASCLCSIDVTDGAFDSTALAAQRCFDERGHLAGIPLEPVLRMASCLPTINLAPAWGVMLSYVDTHLPPMNARSAKEWFELGVTVYLNAGVAGQVSLWFCRSPLGLSLTAAYPANADRSRVGRALHRHAHEDMPSRGLRRIRDAGGG